MKTSQIVKGLHAGTFVILGLVAKGGENGAQLKCVNPNDHSQVASGELWLPLSKLKIIAA